MFLLLLLLLLLNLFLFFVAMLGYFFVKLLGSPMIYVYGTCLPVYITFYYCFALDTTFLPIKSLTYKIS